MRFFVLSVLTGCAFTGSSAGDDVPPLDDPTVDAMPQPTEPDDGSQPTVGELCDAADVDVRFCMDFEDPQPFANKAPYSLNVQAQNVGLVRTSRGQVAAMTPYSQITIGESPTLDVDELTTALWIQPHAPGSEQFLLDNHLQYATVLENDGDIRCMIGSGAVRSSVSVPVSLTSWTHVACTYDRSRIRVYVNGSLEGCADDDRAIYKGSNEGVAVGGNKESTGVVDEFSGGLDLVRVYSRVLSSTELCTAAGRTDCKDECP